MLNAIMWGAIQGLTEFLPISSSGHLVLIPALLGRDGPDLATSAMLHLGTLVAVLVYFRKDLVAMARFDRAGRRMITIIVIGTIPAVILGLAFESKLDELTERPSIVAVMLIVTGLILLGTMLLRPGDRTAEELTPTDAGLIGLAQSFDDLKKQIRMNLPKPANKQLILLNIIFHSGSTPGIDSTTEQIP